MSLFDAFQAEYRRVPAPAATPPPVPCTVPPSEPAMPPETSADDEAFVTELATSLVILITKWRERAGFVGAHERSAETYDLCAAELEAVLRSAT